MRFHRVVEICLMVSWLLYSGTALAAPSQALSTDVSGIGFRLTIASDALGPVFGRFDLGVEYAPLSMHSFWFRTASSTTNPGTDVELGIGYHINPGALGLDGMFVGLESSMRIDESEVAPRAAVDAGYRLIVEGWTFALHGRCEWNLMQSAIPAPAVQLRMGWSFL